MDVQVAYLANQGMNYLVSGVPPVRLGNYHPNIAPYQAVQCSDGFFILAVGNDKQFISACKALDLEELTIDSRFKTNSMRVKNRELLKDILNRVNFVFVFFKKQKKKREI